MKPATSLLESHPVLAGEAVGWDPEKYTAGSGKKLRWRCSFKHEWDAIVSNRVKGSGCPICSNRTILPGFNDLQTKNPDIASEADGWDPTLVGPGSHKILSWRCKEGHTWSASVNHRTAKNNSTGCPICAGQKIVLGVNDLFTTHPEIASQAFDWNPRTEFPNSRTKLKWKCPEGHVWLASLTSRKRGSGCLVCAGKEVSKNYKSLSIDFPQIATEAFGWNPEEVLSKSGRKLEWKCKRNHKWFTTPANRTSGHGCPYCTNQKVAVGENDLLTLFPKEAKQADGWDPATIVAGSNKKMKWKCELGHRWEATVSSRTTNGNGCPFCSGLKVWPGFNDLATTHPLISSEAVGWDPTKYSAGQSKGKFGWVCALGHHYTARIDHRATGVSSCHFCSGHRVLVGFNDLATLNPELAAEACGWDPTTVTLGSSAKVKWMCSAGHKWQATVGDRKKTGCPTCSKTGFDPNKPGWLYFGKHELWGLLQIGISNNVENRFRRHRQFGWEILEVRGPMDGHLTQQLETDLLRMLKKKGAEFSTRKDNPGKLKNENSREGIGVETWVASTYPVTNLKELMELLQSDS